MSRSTRTVIVGLVVIVIAAAIALWAGTGNLFNPQTPQQQAASMMVNGKLVGKNRDDFIAATASSCNVSAMRTNPNASLPQVDTACKCVAAKEADSITQDQIAYLLEHRSVSPDLEKTIQRQLDECLAAK